MKNHFNFEALLNLRFFIISLIPTFSIMTDPESVVLSPEQAERARQIQMQFEEQEALMAAERVVQFSSSGQEFASDDAGRKAKMRRDRQQEHKRNEAYKAMLISKIKSQGRV